MFLRIKSFFMAVIIALGTFGLLFRPSVPAPKSLDEFMQGPTIVKPVALADEVYAVDGGVIGWGNLDIAICLQGLANRDAARLCISGGVYSLYMNDMCKEGVKIISTDAEGKPWTLETIIKEMKPYITDNGYVLYRETEFAEGLNVACNYATVEGWLAVPERFQDLAERCGLVLKKDISKDTYDYKFLQSFFDEYKDCFNKKAVVHVKNVAKGMRDLAIQQNFLITYSTYDKPGKRYLKKLLKWTGGNAYFLGWTETEKHFVRYISDYGCSIVPADYSRNNSFLVAGDGEIPQQTCKREPITPDPDKHYTAIVFSDGDNLQWTQNGFTEYFQKIQKYDTFPMTWTFPLVAQELAPASSKRTYAAAGEQNLLVAGVSGSGYMNPSHFKPKYLDRFTTETAVMMKKSNMDIVTILDDKPSLIGTKTFEQNFDYYSRFDNIRGGLVMLDPDRYESGKGKIWFSNDKPFISVRLSLWNFDSDGSGSPNEWIEEQAAIVNAYAHDPYSVEGYSYININPWSVSVANMAYFVSLLDEDIVLVTADQLIDMVAQNVPHVDAAPSN